MMMAPSLNIMCEEIKKLKGINIIIGFVKEFN
jgi:hypothetical protein